MSPARSWIARFLAVSVGAVVFAFTSVPAVAQQGIGTVRGVVVDDVARRPIASAQVFVTGTDLGTVTNSSGEFEINLPAGTHRLSVRRVGYATTGRDVTVAPGQVSEANFELTQVVILLDEVVVTGAGAATEKKRLGNTIASIKSSEIENAPTINFSEMLAAREPGVVINQSGGSSGEGARIRIRGSASLSQSNEPIVYVDGIRIDNGGGFGLGDQGFFVGGGGAPSRLDDVNPESIERVEILKGAAAATLYGTEASNGVIQIFTKKGARGAPQFDFSVEQGFSNINETRYKSNTGFARDAAQAADLSTFWATAPNCRIVATNGACSGIQPFEIFEVNYMDELFGTGYTQTYSANVSGGTGLVTYFVSGRFNTDDGPFTTDTFDGNANDFNRKVQANGNIEILPSEKLRIRINTLYADVHHETPQNNNNIFGVAPAAMDAKPELAECVTTFGEGTPNGDGTCDPVGNPEGATFATTREVSQATVTQDTKHFALSGQFQYSPIAELSLDATVGVDVTNAESIEFFPFGWNVDLFAFFDAEGLRAIDDRNRREITVEAKGQWDRRFADISSTLVVGGQGFIARTTRNGGFGTQFPGPGLEVAGAAANNFVFESFTEVVNAGFFAQEQLGFYDVVFVTGGFRLDRNSAFGESFGAVFYPKASFSFVPSDLANWTSTALSTVRIRGAVGKSGLQPAAFDQFTTFGAQSTVIGPALVPDNLGNPDLEPEKATEWEIGGEIGLFEDRLSFDVTYWDRVTKDALFSRQFPPSGGFENQQIVNIGQIDANGFEVAANALIVNQENLTARFFANASYIDEVVTDLGSAPPLKIGGAYVRYRNWLREGFAPGAYFGTQLVDVPAGFTPFDINGDGQPDSEAEMLAFFDQPRGEGDINCSSCLLLNLVDGDKYGNFLGKPTPDWQGSFGFNVGFLRNLELSSLFEYKAGNFQVHNLTDAFRSTHPAIGRNFFEATEVERTLEDPSSTPQERLDAALKFANELKHLDPRSGLNAVKDADFLRWRELALTWRVPGDWVRSKLGFRYLTLNASIRNLKLWTGYDGIDPETNLVGRGGGTSSEGTAVEQSLANNFAQGIDAWGIPLQRRFTFSVRFGI